MNWDEFCKELAKELDLLYFLKSFVNSNLLKFA